MTWGRHVVRRVPGTRLLVGAHVSLSSDGWQWFERSGDEHTDLLAVVLLKRPSESGHVLRATLGPLLVMFLLDVVDRGKR